MARDYDACGCRNERIFRSRSIAVTPGTPTLTAHLFLPRMSEIRLHVNGLDHVVAIGDPLLYVLRDDLALHGPKFGCGLGGACAVLVDGEAIRACVTRAVDMEERAIAGRSGQSRTAQPDAGRLHRIPAVQRRVFERQPDPNALIQIRDARRIMARLSLGSWAGKGRGAFAQ